MGNIGATSRCGLHRAVVLFALLAGLFAMHGLSDHGMTHESMFGPGTGPASSMTSSMTSSMDRSADRSVAPAVGAASPLLPTSGSGPMAAMCVVLLLAGLALVLALSGRAEAWRYAVQRAAPVRNRSRARARAPDPPDLTRLGLCRC